MCGGLTHLIDRLRFEIRFRKRYEGSLFFWKRLLLKKFPDSAYVAHLNIYRFVCIILYTCLYIYIYTYICIYINLCACIYVWVFDDLQEPWQLSLFVEEFSALTSFLNIC